jgi:release factor glutamine methyltransferase
VFAEDEAALLLAEASDADQLERMVGARVEGLPLEQVLGWAELLGVRVAVSRDVFVPRRRSELLAREALAAASSVGGRPVVLDLCCGCGAVGVAVATLHGDVELHAAELDAASAACARGNVVPRGGSVHEGDLYDALPETLRGRVDVLVVNAPYVPTAELDFMPVEAREHEPRMALDGGADGVEIQRRVAAGAPGWMTPGGVLLVETSERQAPLTVAAFGSAGLRAHVVTDDELGATVVVGSSRTS